MQKSLVLAAALVAIGCAKVPASETDAAPMAQAPASASDQANAAPASETTEITASGDLDWTPGAALPEGAFVRVSLLDISLADAAAEPLAEATYPVAGGPPVRYSLTTAAEIEPDARLTVLAQITDGKALYFTSDTNYPVSPTEGERGLTIELVAVDVGAGTDAGVTTEPIAYLCGEDPVGIAIEAGAAYVTAAGDETQKLDKLSGGDAAPQTFTNGPLTVFVDGSDMDGPKLRLARGKAAAAACVPAS